MRWVIAMLFAASCGAACAHAEAPRVEVVKTPDGYRLMRGGEPYFVKGAGGSDQLDLLASTGANSIRTWGTNDLEPRRWPDGAFESVLDRAHARGLTVCAGFWMKHTRHGFDYDDDDAVERQIEEAVAWVNKWKHHPAILMWGVGNEVSLDGSHEQVFPEIDRLAAAIKEADPSRPTMTALAGIWPNQGAQFARLCPNIDILGLNAYGGLAPASHAMLSQGYTGPFIVTEFGPFGHWECGLSQWGAPVEQSSAGKARAYRESYQMTVLDQPHRCLGAYAFLWGHKQEVTYSWFGMLLPTGEKLEQVDTMTELWSGRPPSNRCPRVEGLESDAALRRVAPGTSWTVRALATEPDSDPMTYRWSVFAETTDRRTGGDAETVPPQIEGRVAGGGEQITLTTPLTPGPYRLYVEVVDDQRAAGTANMPFYVAANGARPD